jgi:hypothetical protein
MNANKRRHIQSMGQLKRGGDGGRGGAGDTSTSGGGAAGSGGAAGLGDGSCSAGSVIADPLAVLTVKRGDSMSSGA